MSIFDGGVFMDDKDIFSFSDPESNENESLDLNSFSSGAVDNARRERTRKKLSKQRFLKMFLTVSLGCFFSTIRETPLHSLFIICKGWFYLSALS